MSEAVANAYEPVLARNVGAAIGHIPKIAFGAVVAALSAAVIASAIFKVPFYQVVNVLLAIQYGVCALQIGLALISSLLFLFAFFAELGSDDSAAEKFGYFRMIFMPLLLIAVAAVPVYSGSFTYMAYAYVFHLPLEGQSFIFDWFISTHKAIGHALYQLAQQPAATQVEPAAPESELSFADWVSLVSIGVIYPAIQHMSQLGQVGQYLYNVWIWLFPAAAKPAPKPEKDAADGFFTVRP